MDVCRVNDKVTPDFAYQGIRKNTKNTCMKNTIMLIHDMCACFIQGCIDCEKDGQLQGTCTPRKLLPSVWPLVVFEDAMETVLSAAFQYWKEESTTSLQEN